MPDENNMETSYFHAHLQYINTYNPDHNSTII